VTRVGYGEDAHALAPGRPLVLGNVAIGSDRGARAHSDGDALLHALADAILSALALGDIGDHFPPSDPAYRGLDSAVIVQRALALAREAAPGLRLVNVAAVVTLDAPKLGPHRDAVRRRVAELLGVVPEQVGLTFKTSEGLAPDHVQARAVVLLEAESREL
jgi:2-C-methyl-D-erythritol 2,4-cyclodiphosphate synthase